jgi:rubrerythrin
MSSGPKTDRPLEELARDKGYRHSIDRKLRAAGRLMQAALIDLNRATVQDLTSEFDRRDLEMLARALASLVTDLSARLSSLAANELLLYYACPHCGWSRPCLEDGMCPRCQQLREAYCASRVVALADRRRRARESR